LPLRADEVDPSVPFTESERLFRRVSPNGFNAARELLPSELNTFSFDKDIDSAPSVMRSLFCDWIDVLSFDCSQRDVSDWQVFYLNVQDLPSELPAGDGRGFTFFPVHRPLALCGAHSVISSAVLGDETRTYVAPPRPVRNALRTKLATILKPIEQSIGDLGSQELSL